MSLKGIWFWLLLCVSSQLFADEWVRKVIELNHRDARQIITLVQPLLSQGESITGQGQTLVVKLRPETLSQVRAIIHQLDKPLITFTIMVHQGDADWIQSQNSNTRVISTQSRLQRQSTQSVRVLNGESAFINTDTEVPIVTEAGIGLWTGVSLQQRPVQTGLWVAPELKGQQVLLKLRRLRQQENPAGGQRFDDQTWQTTMMVPLNQWVSVGSAEAVNVGSRARVYRAGAPFNQQATLFIKVSIDRQMPTADIGK